MRQLLFLILVFDVLISSGQAGMVINNDAFIVMNNQVYIVLDNPSPSAMAVAGSGGNIICEDEFNIIKWNCNTSTGSYILPFTTASGVKIPLTVNITTAGAGSGSILYSTYNGPVWDNDSYKPTGVLNMTNMAAVNNSSEVIDRFWMIDAQGYSTKPEGTIQFNYDDAEHLAAGNTITESDLKAERYDEPTDNWELYPVGGTVNTISNYVTGVPFNALDFTRTWTLLDQTSHILPVILVSFETACVFGNVEISWQTAQEVNSDYFILQGGDAENNFETIATIPAAGFSQSSLSYSYSIAANPYTYFRLLLANLDGSVDDLGIQTASCNAGNDVLVDAYASGLQQITLAINGIDIGIYELRLFDLAGNLIFSSGIPVGNNNERYIISDSRIAAGIYILSLRSTEPENPFIFNKSVQVFK